MERVKHQIALKTRKAGGGGMSIYTTKHKLVKSDRWQNSTVDIAFGDPATYKDV